MKARRGALCGDHCWRQQERKGSPEPGWGSSSSNEEQPWMLPAGGAQRQSVGLGRILRAEARSRGFSVPGDWVGLGPCRSP